MLQVIKKGGKKQVFSAAKFKKAIYDAARDIKWPAAKSGRLAASALRAIWPSLRRRKTVKSADLRKKSLAFLNRKAKPVAAAWRKYDARHRARRRR